MIFFNDINDQIKKIKRNIDYQKDELKAIIQNKDIEETDATFKGVLASVRRISDSYGDDLEKLASHISSVGELHLKEKMTSYEKRMVLGMLDNLGSIYHHTLYEYDWIVLSKIYSYKYEYDKYKRKCISSKISELCEKWREIVEEDLIKSNNKNKSENSFNKVIKRLNKIYDEETDIWSKEDAELDKYIKQETKKRIKELNKELNKKIDEKQKKFLDLYNDVESKKNKLKQDNNALNEEFNKLCIFNIIKKEKIKENILENNRLIFIYNEELNKLKQDYEKQKEKLTKENEKQKIKIEKEIKNTIVRPEEPYEIIHWLTCKYNSLEYNNRIYIKRKIRYILSKHSNSINEEEIMNCFKDLIAIGESNVRRTLFRMLNQEVERLFYNGKFYYKAIPDRKNVIREKKLLDSQTNTEFSIQRNKVYEKLKALDQECNLMKELRDEFSDLKEFRIYQILNSLENDGVELEYQDGILIFDLNTK